MVDLQVPIFEQIGPIYELRLMLDFSQSNRGYFFVRYTCKEDAKKAVKMLNKFEIRPRKFIGVVSSVDNRKLWVNGLPKDRSAAEIKVRLLCGCFRRLSDSPSKIQSQRLFSQFINWTILHLLLEVSFTHFRHLDKFC